MYIFDIDLGLNREYEDLVSDMIKYIVAYAIMLLLGKFMYGKYDSHTIQYAMFFMIGILFYHLVVKKVIHFNFDDNTKEGFFNYSLY